MLNFRLCVATLWKAPRAGLVLALATIFGALTICLNASDAVAGAPGKTYFFATRDACAASGAFRQRECEAAFRNAQSQLRDRAPRFSARGDCRLKYHYCETLRIESQEGDTPEESAYSPLALGVEMMVVARGVVAAPVLAVETPASLFPHFPVSREYVARASEPSRDEALAYNAILPADRFAPFPKNSASRAIASFVPLAPETGKDEAPIGLAMQEESPQERRARLKNAPFIE